MCYLLCTLLALWRASFPTYPQEIGLAFEAGVISMEQVQILSHQFKIAQRIELFVGLGPSYNRAAFTRLGYVRVGADASPSPPSSPPRPSLVWMRCCGVSHGNSFVACWQQ